MRGHYAEEEIVSALRAAGVSEGDTLFSHVSLLNLGLMKGVRDAHAMVPAFKRALHAVIGDNGCFLTPTYSYSFCKGEPYNPSTTPSDCGPFSNQLLEMSDVTRSLDPIFSVAGFGRLDGLMDDLPADTFGAHGVYDRLLQRRAKIVNIGLSLFYITPIHHLEKMQGVPYRFDKVFNGIIEHADQTRQSISWNYYVRHLDLPSEPDCSELERRGELNGIVRKVPLGIGHITSAPLVPYFELAKQCMRVDPWFLTVNAAWKGKINPSGEDKK